jgi:predicted Zn finger-like uncharacterized protein
VKFSCPQCERQYQVPDELIRGKAVRVRCKGCGAQIPVGGGDAAGAELSPVSGASVVPAPYEEPAAAGGPWYAMHRGNQVGPMDERAFSSRVKVGDFHARTYVWRDGMANWVRASEVPELARLLPAGAPPSPPPPPPESARTVSNPSNPSAAVARTVSNPSNPSAAVARTVSSPGTATSRPAIGVASSSGPEVDPFAAFGSADPNDLPPPGEQTMVAIARAGVNKRNPPWKFALFAAVILGIPYALFLGLANLEVKQVVIDEAGNKVEVEVKLGEVAMEEGLSGLGDLLMGRKKKKDPPPAKPRVEGETGTKKPAESAGTKPSKKPEDGKNGPSPADDPNAFIGGPGPKVRPEDKPVNVDASNFNKEAAAKVLADNASSFQGCVEAELRKNPNAKLGKLILSVTVAPSGIVTRASVDRKDVNQSGLGECLQKRAKRMRFNAFEGEPVDLEAPIVTGTSY